MMNRNRINRMAAGIFFVLCTALSSCQYEAIGEADFPEGIIYLPAAKNGNYVIDYLPDGSTTYRFQVDVATNTFTVPLSVYRSGLDLVPSFPINIQVDADTVAALLSSGALGEAVAALPQAQYQLASSVEMKQGERTAPFTLTVDLHFLTANEADQQAYALAVNIASEGCKTSSELGTVIILIAPRILHPVADFTYREGTEARQIRFTGTSLYSMASHWDFGDGTTSSEASPDHLYASPGEYPVKLTVTGISGLTSEKTLNVTVE
jgi:hypothetical protein